MVVGASDTGKSTFAHWLFKQLSASSSTPLAFLDGDPGQSILGPPTTITLALARAGMARFPGSGRRWRRFTGSTTPRNHVPPFLVSVARLVEVARSRSTRTIVYDTTGLVDPYQGGVALKLAKIDLLRPEVLIAIRRRDELEPLLAPLRRSAHMRIVELGASPALRPRNMAARQRHRARRFARHFAGAALLEVNVTRFPVSPDEFPGPNQLLAFEDAAGFTLALGIATRSDKTAKTAAILTPIRSLSAVHAIRLADMTVDPVTFRDQML
jgi:polynucleotide 5'-hydroxyl-kinase GRC3/NOL9